MLLAVVVLIGGLIFKGNVTMAKRLALALVIEVEVWLGDIQGTGPYKYNYVAGIIYSKLPNWLKGLMSEDRLANMIDKWIEDAVKELHKMLQEKPLHEIHANLNQ